MFCFLVLLVGAAAAFDLEIQTNYETLDRPEFVKYFNNLNLTFKIDIERLDPGHKHCSFITHDLNLPMVNHDLTQMTLPQSFDAREKWSNCPSIGKIYDQMTCGSCWMFGTATTATDRNCIHANIYKDLSEQDLSCCEDCYKGDVCAGGNPVRALVYWKNNGLVSYDCQPYNADALEHHQYCVQSCNNGANYNQDKTFGAIVYQISPDENQIKAELFTNGPIEASFTVFQDLEEYTHGVYVHKYGQNKGLHSVRIIGYGEEDGEKYWLIANSWGTRRGINGFYKIKQFQPELGLENMLHASMPKGF